MATAMGLQARQKLSSPGPNFASTPQARQAPGAPTLLWLPAMGVPTDVYRLICVTLEAADLDAAVLEWRGMGASPLRAAHTVDWGYQDLLDDELHAAISALRAHIGSAALVLLRHSLGGHLALLHRAQGGAGVAAIALIGAGSPYCRAFDVPQAQRILALACGPAGCCARCWATFPLSAWVLAGASPSA